MRKRACPLTCITRVDDVCDKMSERLRKFVRRVLNGLFKGSSQRGRARRNSRRGSQLLGASETPVEPPEREADEETPMRTPFRLHRESPPPSSDAMHPTSAPSSLPTPSASKGDTSNGVEHVASEGVQKSDQSSRSKTYRVALDFDLAPASSTKSSLFSTLKRMKAASSSNTSLSAINNASHTESERGVKASKGEFLKGSRGGNGPEQRKSSRPSSLVDPPTASSSSAAVDTAVTHEPPRSSHELIPSPSFDETEEWNEISEIIASISTGLSDGRDDAILPAFGDKEICSRQATMMSSGGEIKDWLARLGQPELVTPFLSRGFDDVQFLGCGILDDNDLMDMGVRDPRNRRRVLEDAAQLPCKLPHRAGDKFDTVESWLAFLSLDFYASKFHRYKYTDMEKVRKMWDSELTTILEITLPGHKKRILASIGTERECTNRLRTSMTSLSSSTSSLISGRSQVSSMVSHSANERREPADIKEDLTRLNNDITEYQTELREKLGYSSTLPKGSYSSTLSRVDRSRKKSRAPQPPSLTSTLPPDAKSYGKILDDDDNNNQTSSSKTMSRPTRSGSVRYSMLPLREPKEIAAGDVADIMAPAHWLHPPSTLINGTCDYSAQYVGSVLIRNLEGVRSSRLSMKKLRKTSDAQKRIKVALRISHEGVRFIDVRSQKTLGDHVIRDINSACQDDDELSYFAYIALDVPSNEHVCHVFVCDTRETSSQIILTLGQAFEVAYQLTLRRLTSLETLASSQLGGLSASLQTSTLPPTFRTDKPRGRADPVDRWRWESLKHRNSVDETTRPSVIPNREDTVAFSEGPNAKLTDGYPRIVSSSSSSIDSSPRTLPKVNRTVLDHKNILTVPSRQDQDFVLNDGKETLRKTSSSSSGGEKPKIPEKPKNVPPKPTYHQTRHSPSTSPALIRKTCSTPRVDVVLLGANAIKADISPVLKRAPLASHEDF